jgi:hypothetical protein
MKKILIAILLMLPAASQAADITAYGLNVKDILQNTRAGVWLPFGGGKTFKTVYTPLIWLHDSTGMEYVALDVGAAAPGDLTQGYAFAAIGFRVDNLLDRALGISNWVKTHVSSATLPTLEVGAGPIYMNNVVRGGASIALRF